MTDRATANIRKILETVPDFGDRIYLATPGEESTFPRAIYSVDNAITYPKLGNPDFVVALDCTIMVQASSPRKLQMVTEAVQEAFRKRKGSARLLEYEIEEYEAQAGGVWEGIMRYRLRGGL